MVEKKASRFAPVLILKEPLTPGSSPSGAEVRVVMICDVCQQHIHDLALADIVIDVDLFKPIGNLLNDVANVDGEYFYALAGSACVVHTACNFKGFGVRISASLWTINRGRTDYRPRFEQQKKTVVH